MGLEVTGRYRYPPPDPAWLARHDEPVIEPDLPIVDAHHHLWVEGGHPYLLDQLVADVTSGHRIEATVFVQAGYAVQSDGPVALRPVGETQAVEAIRRDTVARGITCDVAAAIIAFADLTLGDRVAEILDAHAAASSAFRGVRHSVSHDPAFPDGIVIRPAPPGLLGDAGYRDGLRELSRRGLTYDAMLYHGQIRELADVARALPDLVIILDHLGCLLGVGPYASDRNELITRWAGDMAALAECPNVRVKLGGQGMIITGARWHERPTPPTSNELADAWRPLIHRAIDLFGADRCLFESNFPVDKAMTSYRVLWNAFKRLADGASPDERAALFSGTATHTYRLEQVALAA